MRDSTKLWIEVEGGDVLKVDTDACDENGYNYKEYFLNPEINERDLKIDFSDEEQFEEWEEEIDEEDSDKTLIQLKVSKVLEEINKKPDDVEKFHLYIPTEYYYGNWDRTPGYEESYALGCGAFIVLEFVDQDAIIYINSDFYDSWDPDFESAELKGVFI